MGKFLARLPRSVFLTRAKTGIAKILNTLFITTNLTVYYPLWTNQFFLDISLREHPVFSALVFALGGCKLAPKKPDALAGYLDMLFWIIENVKRF